MTHLVEVPRESVASASRSDAELVADVAMGIVGATVGAGMRLMRATSELPVLRSWAGWQPPLVPARWQPAAVLDGVARRGARHRAWAAQNVERLLDQWTPVMVEMVVSRLDLTGIVTRHVNLDEVVRAVDLDAAVAGVDLDAVVQRIDLDAAVQGVDLNAVVEGVDIDAIASRLDIGAVIDRVDLVAMVEGVIAAIDLPAIIRDSSGLMASETVRAARMTGISADDTISRTLERHFLRRRPPAQLEEPSG